MDRRSWFSEVLEDINLKMGYNMNFETFTAVKCKLWFSALNATYSLVCCNKRFRWITRLGRFVYIQIFSNS